MYKIEKNIPVGMTNERSVYPFSIMEVGDSFFVKGDKKKVTAVSVAINYYKKSHKNTNFTLRSTAEGARVWRIK